MSNHHVYKDFRFRVRKTRQKNEGARHMRRRAAKLEKTAGKRGPYKRR